MSASKPHGNVEFGGAAKYRIVVQGALTGSWRDRLGGLTITTSKREGERALTTLTGEIRDQAELNGVLDTLYGLHLAILKVEKLDEDS